MSNGIIIGLTGYAGSGKSEVARIMEKEGIERRHMGAPMKAMLEALGLTDDEINGDRKELPCARLLGATPRWAQISLGTEWGRNMIHPDLWLYHWIETVKPGDCVLNESVRFANEARVIRERGGYIIRIERPGVGPIKFKNKLGEFAYRWFGIMWGVHISERVDLLEPDFIIRNDGDLEDLLFDVLDVLEMFGNPSYAKGAA